MAEFRGQVNLDAMLARKPLHAAEKRAAPATVCVTGGASYVGSRIVARLLACGHSVHATYGAAGEDTAAMQALNDLPGAHERLRWHEADLAQPGSCDAAMHGCQYVIHAAGATSFSASSSAGRGGVLETVLRGTKTVLAAVNRSASVEKVVLTSSLAAASGHLPDRGPGHVCTEADWNLDFLQLAEPHVMAAVLAEWQAWAAAAQQTRWRLISICPGTVYGPPLASSPQAGPVPSIVKLLDGTYYPFVAPVGLATVDVDDVAAAHVLAAVLPEAQGRYLLCERSLLMTDMTAMLRRMYPSYWVPYVRLPYWAGVPLMALLGFGSFRWIRSLWEKEGAQVDYSKTQKELGLEFIPLEQTLQDMVDRLLQLGIMQRIPNPAYVRHPLAAALAPGASSAGVAARKAAAAGAGAARQPVIKEE